jgi:phage-related protein
MQKLLTYITGALALLIVVVSVVSAIYFAAISGTETIKNLALSTLNGIGIAIGGCLGSALILRFQAARDFLKKLVGEVHPR